MTDATRITTADSPVVTQSLVSGTTSIPPEITRLNGDTSTASRIVILNSETVSEPYILIIVLVIITGYSRYVTTVTSR